MGVTKIEWCDYVFNSWTGCTKVSPACDHCYAESWVRRSGLVEWGNQPRRRTSKHYWKQPIRWNRAAEREGIRRKVFCCSLADVFDNKIDDTGWRDDLWELIRSCPSLDWLLLTKRPQNIANRLPAGWMQQTGVGLRPWSNVWLGTTVENQEEADRRIPHLLATPATVHFLSCEPLLGQLDLHSELCRRTGSCPTCPMCLGGLDWVIAGGESGSGARPAHPAWFRSLRDQCVGAGVPFFFKQWGEWAPDDPTAGHTAMRRVGKKAAGALLDGREWREFPA
jgi:protein gp37